MGGLIDFREHFPDLKTMRREPMQWRWLGCVLDGVLAVLFVLAAPCIGSAQERPVTGLPGTPMVRASKQTEGLPATPGPDYGPTYDALKAYLITTSHHDKSTKLFLTPVLMKWWTNGRTVDADRAQLAQKQFDFYADQLKEDNPYSKENDSAAIDRSRRYLAQFAGAERVLELLLGRAGRCLGRPGHTMPRLRGDRTRGGCVSV